MRASTRRTLTIWWVVVLACMVLPFIVSMLGVNLAGITAIAWFFSIGLMIVTLRKVERDAHLQRPGWYRAALVVQLALAAVGTITAARTVFAHGVPGLITVASADLAASVLTYRALVLPSPKRALWSALFGVTVAFMALMIDIALDIHYTGIGHSASFTRDAGAIAIFASVFFQPVIAGIVALATVRVFGDRTNLPDAKASLHPGLHDHVD